jgi:DNA-directed RNA polymerase subunit RPC12/RpoP
MRITVVITPPNVMGKGKYSWRCLGCGRSFRDQSEAEDAVTFGCPGCRSKTEIELVRRMPKKIKTATEAEMFRAQSYGEPVLPVRGA